MLGLNCNFSPEFERLGLVVIEVIGVVNIVGVVAIFVVVITFFLPLASY